jgi:hypothetical protein
MGRRPKARRVEDPREVDTIKVNRGEDVHIGACGLQAVYPHTTTKVVGTLNDHDSARCMRCFGQTAKSELRS